MTIPRLPQADNSLSVNLFVSPKLAPYFLQFYRDAKLDGDTPESFLLRVMKKSALDHYKTFYVNDRLEQAKKDYLTAISAIKGDAKNISVEID